MAKGLPATEPETEEDDSGDERSAWAQHSATRAFENDLVQHLANRLANLVQTTMTSTDPAVRGASEEYVQAKIALTLLRKHGQGKRYVFKQSVQAP